MIHQRRSRVISMIAAWLLSALGLAACAETRYVDLDSAKREGEENLSRTVYFRIDREFYLDFPNCVMVMRTTTAEDRAHSAQLVEAALARHLAMKVSRVIGPLQRDITARDMGADLSRPEDRRALAKSLQCPALVFADVVSHDLTYVVVYSEISIGLDIRMERTADARVLWRARHVADRSKGGLPLSPVGALIDGFISTRFASDREVTDSVVDDAVRRLVATLPDIRRFR